MKEKQISIAGFGNPMIDITISENAASITDKYNLKIDTQNDLPPEIYYDELRHEILSDAYKKAFIPGGCVPNTVRSFQWLENEKFKSVMYGSIGSDENGRYLTEQLQKEGVITRFDIRPDAPTMDVIVLTDKQYRTVALTSNPRAACSRFSKAPPHYLEAALSSLSDTKIVVIDGYFTHHCAPFIYRLLEHCQKYDVFVAFSAGGEPVVKANNIDETYLPFVQRSNLLAYNLIEFKAICERVQIQTENIKSALESFCQLSCNVKKTTLCKYSRIIIVTDDENPTHCYTKEEGYVTFPIPALAVNQIIKDTTGAGDAFMAGFLYGISYNKSIVESLQIGYKTAVEIIQQNGCSIPTSRPDFINRDQ